MWRKIQEVHSTLEGVVKFIEWKAYRLGRLQSEMRTEYKKSAYVGRKCTGSLFSVRAGLSDVVSSLPV